MVLTYAAFYGATLYRLSDQRLVLRMQFFAKLLQITSGDFDKRYGEVMQWAQRQKFHFYSADPNDPEKARFDPNNPRKATEASPSERDKFDSDMRRLANTTEKDFVFDQTMASLRPQLLRWFPQNEMPRPTPPWWCFWYRFSIPDFRTKGVEFAEPAGGIQGWRDKAAEFEKHYNVLKDFRGEPVSTQLVPWELIRFYDNTRCDLNNTLPAAFGTILLACGLFIQCRLVDYRLPEPLDPKHTLVAKVNNWVPIWTEETSEKDPQTPSLLRRPVLKWASLAGAVLMLVIEFALNVPAQRIEWLINAPIMMVVGISLPLIWLTLYDLTKATLSPLFLTYSDEFVRRNLTPLASGTLSLVVVTFWATCYSVITLPVTPGNRIRSDVQAVACVATLALLYQVIRRLSKQYKGSSNDRNTSPDRAREKDLNPPDDNPLWKLMFPKLDERFVSGLLMLMLPFQALIKQFFWG